jgi:hypothetical protein
MLKLLTVHPGNTFPRLTNNLVNIHPSWVAGVRHPMVTDEDDINDMREVALA